MNLINKKIKYNENYKFNIVLANMEIGSILKKHIPEVKRNPKLLKTKTKTIKINNVVLLLDEKNLFPNKKTYDRKLLTYLPKKEEKKTYWISKVQVLKQISKTNKL
jgi:hypothetical protein